MSNWFPLSIIHYYGPPCISNMYMFGEMLSERHILWLPLLGLCAGCPLGLLPLTLSIIINLSMVSLPLAILCVRYLDIFFYFLREELCFMYSSSATDSLVQFTVQDVWNSFHYTNIIMHEFFLHLICWWPTVLLHMEKIGKVKCWQVGV